MTSYKEISRAESKDASKENTSAERRMLCVKRMLFKGFLSLLTAVVLRLPSLQMESCRAYLLIKNKNDPQPSLALNAKRSP